MENNGSEVVASLSIALNYCPIVWAVAATEQACYPGQQMAHNHISYQFYHHVDY